MATTRRPVPEVEGQTVGGFLDSIIAGRQSDSGRGKEVDYLAERARISRWLKLLPNDPLQAKEAAFALLSEQNSLKLSFTAERTEALFHFDRGIHDQMLKLETDFLAAQIGGELEDVLWRACSELGRAMIVTYERAFTDNVERMGSRAALLTLTLIIVRIIHYLAWQARLCAYRRIDWIPGRWQQLHRLYRKARAFNIQLHGVSDLSDPARARKTSIESEYLSLMLTWRLNSGTLSRTEIAQAYYWLKDRPRTIVFATSARPGTRLGVDPTQADGLKPVAYLSGGGERFLFDSTVLAEPLSATISRLEERLKAGPREGEQSRLRQQIALVSYLTTHWVVNGFIERAERAVVDRRVEGFSGWPSIATKLRQLQQVAAAPAASANGNAADPGAKMSVTRPANEAGISRDAAANTVQQTTQQTLRQRAGGAWIVRDQSGSGCRVVSPVQRGNALKVGDVVAMNDVDDHWDVALVRRWKLAGDDRVEMGLLWFARNARPLKLFPVQNPHGHDGIAPVQGLGGEPQGGDGNVLLALLPTTACSNLERQWERAVPGGKALLKIDAIELPGVDWCWTRLLVLSLQPGLPGRPAVEQLDEEITEIEITAPRDSGGFRGDEDGHD